MGVQGGGRASSSRAIRQCVTGTLLFRCVSTVGRGGGGGGGILRYAPLDNHLLNPARLLVV